jgi:hypothetical protein
LVVVAVVLGIMQVKQVRAVQAVAPEALVMTVIDLLCLPDLEILDKVSLEEVVEDLIDKAIINTAVAVVVVQAVLAKIAAITDMNIGHKMVDQE